MEKILTFLALFGTSFLSAYTSTFPSVVGMGVWFFFISALTGIGAFILLAILVIDMLDR